MLRHDRQKENAGDISSARFTEPRGLLSFKAARRAISWSFHWSGSQFAQFRLRQVHQQLREIQLRINLVPAAGAGQASQNCKCAPAARVADKKGILPVQHDTLHLTLTLLSMGTAPSLVNTASSSHWPSV
jgi:hypothetical protein